MYHTFGRVSACLSHKQPQAITASVRLVCRDLVAELPFILMHPKPDDIDDNLLNIENSTPNNNNNNGKNRNGDKQLSGNESDPAKDDAPNLIQLDG